MAIAVFPGSFDPFTKGHLDIVQRGAGLFEKVVIGIGVNASKSRYYPLEQMIAAIKQTTQDLPNVEVQTYQGLTALFAQEVGATYLLRGLRNTTDFEYENSIAQGNRHVVEGLETVFMITDPQLAYISSSVVRDIHRYGGDVSAFLPHSLDSL